MKRKGKDDKLSPKKKKLWNTYYMSIELGVSIYLVKIRNFAPKLETCHELDVEMMIRIRIRRRYAVPWNRWVCSVVYCKSQEDDGIPGLLRTHPKQTREAVITYLPPHTQTLA